VADEGVFQIGFLGYYGLQLETSHEVGVQKPKHAQVSLVQPLNGTMENVVEETYVEIESVRGPVVELIRRLGLAIMSMVLYPRGFRPRKMLTK